MRWFWLYYFCLIQRTACICVTDELCSYLKVQTVFAYAVSGVYFLHAHVNGSERDVINVLFLVNSHGSGTYSKVKEKIKATYHYQLMLTSNRQL